MKIKGVYKLTSPDGKVYIGKSSNILNRFKNHYYLDSQPIFKAIKSFGFDKFDKEILFTTENEDYKNILNDMEEYYIKKYNSTDLNIGYNVTRGGSGIKGYKHTSETKIKIGDFNRGQNRNPKTKIILQYDKNGNFIKRWNGTKEIERELGIFHSYISAVCRLKYKTTNGFIFKYENNSTIYEG